jgi:hypothetical protein
MPFNGFNMLKTPAKKAGGGITLSFDSMTGVTLHTGTPGWKVYTISSTTAMTRTITANVLTDTSINIVVCGGGGGGRNNYSGGWTSHSGGGGGGRFRQASKRVSALTPTQTFTCTIPAVATGDVNGGTSSITFSNPLVGDISCGGGGYGSSGSGGNAPANGGSGGGGGVAFQGWGWWGSIGGTGVNGGNGGRGNQNGGMNWVGPGGGGGAGGNGGDGGTANGAGLPGPGVPTTLDGIKLVYNSSYMFCDGGSGNNYFGSGANITVNVNTSVSGRPGAIIIAVPE